MESYKKEIIELTENLKLEEKKLNLKIAECRDKDLKMNDLQVKVDELSKTNSVLMEKINSQEKLLNESVSYFIFFY